MKKTILLLMLAFAVSCTEDTQNQEVLDSQNFHFNSLKNSLDFQISKVAFEYSNTSDLETKVALFSKQLVQESLELVREKESKIGYVTTYLSFDNKAASIEGFAYYDKQGKLLESSFADQRNSDPLEELLDGASCPSGYTRLGRCSNFGNTQACVGEYLADYLSENLDSVGDCANVQISVGTLNTTVCGKTC